VSTQTMNPAVLRKTGLEAVAKAVGPLGLVRFLQQFETGAGDYTREREKCLKGLAIEDVVSEIKDRRKKRN